LSKLAQNGYEVHAISSTKREGGDANGIVWHECDLLNSTDTHNIAVQVRATHLLHLAWYAIPGKFWSAEINREWTQASMDLFRYFADSGGKRIVAAGSCAEYDWNETTFSESVTPLRPSTLYGKCKKQLFLELEKFSAEQNISMSWARIFFVYGPGEHADRLVPSVIQRLMRNEEAPCSTGRQVRDFLYVHDAATALVMLLNSSLEGAVNIGSGISVEIRQIVRMIAEKMGKPDLPRFGALPMSQDEPDRLVADITRLTDELGWHPAISLDEGLSHTINWWNESMGGQKL
jgi:nucleoside-diphosphate-sugar epimerase